MCVCGGCPAQWEYIWEYRLKNDFYGCGGLGGGAMVLIVEQALCGMQGGDFGEGGKIYVWV